MIRAVLFDLDGTLVDSERESAEALARVVERLGLPVTQADREFIVGHSWNEIYARLVDAHAGFPVSMTELIARTTVVRAEVIAEQGMKILPGAVEAVARLGANRARALVTGSSRAEAAQALAILGLTDAFPVIFASEDYAHGKPAPDGYLAAATALAVPIEHCLVVEDSRAGVHAGRAAGAIVVAVRAGNYSRQDQSAAHRIVDTLDDLDDELLAELDTLAAAQRIKGAAGGAV